MSTADIGFAPVIEELIGLGELSSELADINRRLAIVVGDFIANHLAHDPMVIEMFASNDRQHFIEGFQAHRQHFERLWVMYLADRVTQ